MFGAIVTWVLFGALLLLQVALWGYCLGLGLRWAKVSDRPRRWILFTTVAVLPLQLLAQGFLRLAGSRLPLVPALLCALVIAMLIPCLMISRLFKVSFRRSLQAWLPTLLSGAVTAAFALLVFRPFLIEAFVLPGNSMAPTLLGRHRLGVCPRCGESSFCSARDDESDPLMICMNFHVSNSDSVDPEQGLVSGDRILTAKFLTARRWDLVVFRYPPNPKIPYVKRLVGLPGETIHIAEGSVWANGEKLVPPESLQGFEYLSEIEGHPVQWGTADRPAELGSDEYFVLGDFSARSADSRVWPPDDDVEHPYAVPHSHLLSVVTCTYWPPARWRAWR